MSDEIAVGTGPGLAMLSASAVREALCDCARLFFAATGNPSILRFDTSGGILKRVGAGEQQDIFASALEPLLDLHKRGLIGAPELAMMKRTALLINTSRGPIVDETAMIAALKAGTIAGAGLDVYDIEPLPAGHPLRSCPNTVLTPHIGFVTEQGYRNFYDGIIKCILDWRRGS